MRKNRLARLLVSLVCLLALWCGASAETRQGVIALEGMEEPIEETLYESPQGFSFWYVRDGMKAYPGTMDGLEGEIVEAVYTGDRMILSRISEADAAACAQAYGVTLPAQTGARVQTEVYQGLEGSTFRFLTMVADGGQYIEASGAYALEAAEGIGKYFARVVDSVAWNAGTNAAIPKEMLGSWSEENEGAGTELTLAPDGGMSLHCRAQDGAAYTCRGTWSYEPEAEDSGQLTLHFTATDNPAKAGDGYDVECVYAAYTESWVEHDVLITCLILNPPIRCSGISPFEEVYGYDGASLYREQGPNMRVVRCKDFVSLREARSKSSKRLARVPLGALVLAFPEMGEGNGFLYCTYQDQEGYILAAYLQDAAQ